MKKVWKMGKRSKVYTDMLYGCLENLFFLRQPEEADLYF